MRDARLHDCNNLATIGSMSLADDIRRLVEADERTDAQIADDAGINRSIVCRLRQGQGLTIDNAERIARAVGYEIALKRLTKRRKAGT